MQQTTGVMILAGRNMADLFALYKQAKHTTSLKTKMKNRLDQTAQSSLTVKQPVLLKLKEKVLVVGTYFYLLTLKGDLSRFLG